VPQTVKEHGTPKMIVPNKNQHTVEIESFKGRVYCFSMQVV